MDRTLNGGLMQPDVTILVVPREQFSKTAQSLESIYAHTSTPFSLVYIDGNSPAKVRRYLERQSKARGFTLVRQDRYLSANEARNIGLPYCSGQYIAFIDNDVEVTPGWLESLMECARETNAAVVGPLYYLGDPRDHVIHTAGADLSIVTSGERRSLLEHHTFVNQDANAVRDQLKRRPIDLVEFHCLLARRDVVEEVGLDKNLLSFLDHNDFCMAVKSAGYAIYTEPKAIVSHLSPPPIKLGDLPYFIVRWSDTWMNPSVRHFAAKHRLMLDDDGLRGHYRYRDAHRLRLVSHLRGAVKRTLGSRVCALLDRVANRYICDRILERFVARRTERASLTPAP
ncbi:MAG: glycosyltransferase [Candidatus Baltobacteraceae bacterium]